MFHAEEDAPPTRWGLIAFATFAVQRRYTIDGVRADRFEGLTEFLAVARRKSFRGAAKDLGVTPGAISQSIRALEKRIALPLFQRTTRSVSLTEAGEALLARIEPATVAIEAALESLDAMRARPTGLLRLTVPHLAVPLFIEPVLPVFRARHPEVTLEVSVDDAFADLSKHGFDAGIRIGESVAQDMTFVRLTGDIRWHVVGAPRYFAKHGHPRTPRDLLQHASIRYRFPSGHVYKWELEERGRAIVVDVPGAITTNDGALQLSLAIAGEGLSYAPDFIVDRYLATKELETTLDDYAPKSGPLCLYFATGAQNQPKLRAFIDTLTELTRRPRVLAAAPRAMATGRDQTR